MKKIKVSFTLSKSIVDELDFMSEELNEKKSHLVEKALDYYFSCVDEKMAIASIEAVEKGKEKLYDFDEIFKGIQTKKELSVK